jgi:predicted amidohydrolase
MDSGCFVAAAGQAYPGPELAAKAPTGVGGSLVASPLGEVLACAGPDPQLVVCDVDVDSVPGVRDTVGVLRNRIRLRTDS